MLRIRVTSRNDQKNEADQTISSSRLIHVYVCPTPPHILIYSTDKKLSVGTSLKNENA